MNTEAARREALEALRLYVTLTKNTAVCDGRVSPNIARAAVNALDTLALPTTPTGEGELPPLPECRVPDANGLGWFTAAQMKAYAHQAQQQVSRWLRLADALAVAAVQAEDDGLWFVARTGPEAYLQQELRRLTAAIERCAPPTKEQG